ncbi:RNA degradosome polyphosphate kinase [Clostridia bacterium]|nr:RNA degradosome polyphosphate kinase [Clostridia bacterium]
MDKAEKLERLPHFNRELSWLEFNERVLEEAQDKTNPLLERFKFLAITASNMDEFFMVRVSGLMDQKAAKINRDKGEGSPKEQLIAISKKAHSMFEAQYNCLNKSLLPALAKEGVRVLKYEDLNEEQRKIADDYYETTIYPILTPMAVDQSRPLPLLNNRSLNFLVELENDSEATVIPEPKDLANDDDGRSGKYAIVQVPTVVKRLFQFPEKKPSFILLEDIIRPHLHTLFSGYTLVSRAIFRIIRDADLEVDEEDSADLLHEIEKSIKRRRWGSPVRIEIEKKMKKSSRNYLQEILNLKNDDIYEINGVIDLTVWFGVAGISGFPKLCNAPITPQPSGDFWERDVFERIRESDVLVFHPYQTFDSVLDFVELAANDPQVLAIKQTLYRVSGNSPIVNSLITAAENGKQVTVLVELKARFDEENNILWAKKLEKAGCHVIYGLVGLKTHCKACLVVRREDDGIRRYIHLGTGNYNDSTARFYTDLGYFTCKETFGADISAMFNLLTGYARNQSFNKILVAPSNMRQGFLRLIKKETQNAKDGKPSKIIAKLNSLVDMEIIGALYDASKAGTKIQLVVRGICCLKSGIEGVSDNIQVFSIIDRFLEHSRIYYFENAGDPLVYLASADWMPRNLDRRVEAAFPVEDENLKKKIIEILNITLSDTLKLRVQKLDGTYEKIDRRGKEAIRSQLVFQKMAEDAIAEVRITDAPLL